MMCFWHERGVCKTMHYICMCIMCIMLLLAMVSVIKIVYCHVCCVFFLPFYFFFWWHIVAYKSILRLSLLSYFLLGTSTVLKVNHIQYFLHFVWHLKKLAKQMIYMLYKKDKLHDAIQLSSCTVYIGISCIYKMYKS